MKTIIRSMLLLITATLAAVCLNAATQKAPLDLKLVWETTVEGAITISPAVASRLIFVTTDSGNLYAINIVGEDNANIQAPPTWAPMIVLLL